MKRFWNAVGFPTTCFIVAIGLAFIGAAIDDARAGNWLSVSLLLWTLSAIPWAISLYRMRRRDRLFYGAFEFVIACGVFYVTSLKMIDRSVSNELSWELITTRFFTFFVLIYFMVRALDNIGEGLKAGSKAQQRWDVIFPKT